MMAGEHTHNGDKGVTGDKGEKGARGDTGHKGPRGHDSAPGNATLVFVTLTLILVGIVAYQAVAFRDFTSRVCKLTTISTTFRQEQAKDYLDFQDQERTNRFIDDTLRAKRIATYQRLHDSAVDTVQPAKELCP